MRRPSKLVDEKHDFTIDEGMVIDAEKLPWAKTEEELNERWRKQVKYDLLAAQARRHARRRSQDPPQEALSSQSRKLDQMEDGEKLELYLSRSHALPRSALQLHVAADPRRVPHLDGTAAAKGSARPCVQEDGYTVVQKIVPGGAAEKDGRLKVGDKIIGVDSKGDGADPRRSSK